MNISSKAFFDFAVQAGMLLVPLFNNPVVNKIFELCKIIQETPPLITWFDSIVDMFDGENAPPDGTFTVTHMPDDIQQIIRPKAAMFGGMGEFAKYLPILIQIYKMWRDSQKAAGNG